MKLGTTEFIISVLNSCDKNIQFTFEEENNEKIPFLDILISRKRNDITTTIYRKSTSNDIYLNWNAPATWKRGTLKALVGRAYVICSTDQILERELKYLENVCQENVYPKYGIKQILDKAFKERSHKNAIYTTLDEQDKGEHTTEKKETYVSTPLSR